MIGIGHTGDWKMKRQKDFIPSDNGGYNNPQFGKASNFYLFVKNELIPFANTKVKKTKSKVFIGHSFGGLIALYMSMKENKLFDHYYSISPSIWANHYELVKMEKEYSTKTKVYQSKITLYAGSLEFLNKVLSSTNEYYNTVRGRNYKGITIKKKYCCTR